MLRFLLSYFSNEKAFTDPAIGNVTLNRYGLHISRILFSDLIYIIRTLPFIWLHPVLWVRFIKDGYLVLENFLSSEDFEKVLEEYNLVYDKYGHDNPLIKTNERGFGSKISRMGGFDRSDGDSVNRFIEVKNTGAICRLFCKSYKFSSLSLTLFGRINWLSKHYLYSLVHGDENSNPDIQREMHRDTYHHAFKTWFYIDDVDEHSGATEFIVGSHLSSPRRLRWEYHESIRKAMSSHDKGGSFRIAKNDLHFINYDAAKQILSKRNTLVIMNVKGFHRRGTATAGTIRRGLYANFRPWAFFPFAH